jgi:LuxR family maltose regulon positive regulatory protein
MESADKFGTADDPAGPAARRIVIRRALIGRLEEAERVTQISAPAGSGKTVLLRSWIAEAGLVDSAACVQVQRQERDPQRFWISVIDALRETIAGSKLVRPLTAAPDLNGCAVVERLLEDLDPLEDRLYLVIDDLDELHSAEALRQLQSLIQQAPPGLRFVLAARHALRLGLHRQRLEGQLTELQAEDLRFSLHEARALFQMAGITLPDSALAQLHARTEGWAAGLRLAALSLAGHPEPEQSAAQFSGSERTVAAYLLDEVLERQSEKVRRMLLRTSVCERINGELADLLTGDSGSEAMLADLEEAGAFVVALDARRSWFRYHQLFADLLQRELRRTSPDELAALHGAAARWYGGHGLPTEAVRHAQAALDWDLAARLLFDHWLDLVLGGQGATAHQLLTSFPANVVAADAELTALTVVGELTQGSLETAERHLTQAIRGLASLPEDRRGRFRVVLAVLGLWLARQRGDLPAAREEVQRLLACAEDLDMARRRPGEDLRALALIGLAIGEAWTDQEQAERHFGQSIALARRLGRPYLEVDGLANWAMVAWERSARRAVELSMQAIELARRHGWTEEPVTTPAYVVLGVSSLSQGRLEQAKSWLDRAEHAVRPEVQSAEGIMVHYARGALELACGREHEALAAFRAAERRAGLLVTPHPLARRARAFSLHAFLRLGETEVVESALAGLDEQQRETAEMRIVLGALRLAQDHPQAAADALAPVVNGSLPVGNPRTGLVQAFFLEAITRDALGDPQAAARALERALEIAEPDSVLFPFLLHRAPGLLDRHRRTHTAHAAMIGRILDLLTQGGPDGPGNDPAEGSVPRPGASGGMGGPGPGESGPEPPARGLALAEPLTHSETRVLRYLPTHLSAPEIAGELYVSVSTVKTHMSHLYAKLGSHRRAEAVDRARALGLLAPTSHPVAG